MSGKKNEESYENFPLNETHDIKFLESHARRIHPEIETCYTTIDLNRGDFKFTITIYDKMDKAKPLIPQHSNLNKILLQ